LTYATYHFPDAAAAAAADFEVVEAAGLCTDHDPVVTQVEESALGA
jgi:hypothetical protein